MRAVVWHGRRDVRIADVPDPGLVHPHDAIVRVTSTAICGSDLHLYNGFIPGMRRGDVLGHEFMGEVVAAGQACEKVGVGDRVVVMCSIACGRCWFCKRDRTSLCDNSNPASSRLAVELAYGHAGAAIYGSSHLFGGYAGGQAEYVRVPFADVGCLAVPPELTDEQVLLLGDLLPTGYAAAESCEIAQGDTVAVFGCGPVGQLAIRSARLLGAERVLAVDRVPERLAMAADGGAIVVDETHGGVRERLDELTGGRGPDACIDAVGMEAHGPGAALRAAILACRKGGVVSIAGVYGGLVDKFPIGAAFTRGLRFAMGQTDFHPLAPRLLERVQARELDPTSIITHRVDFEELPRAYRMFDDQAEGCVKVIARVA